jgi:dienelactone hydrolase
MITIQNDSDSAVVVLHEIYGINRHIRQVCEECAAKGFDVYCPDLLAGNVFDYAQDAYEFYMKVAGFEAYRGVNDLIVQLRPKYRKIFLLGFSAGATVAWRCAESCLCDGIIGCYGSRIRDYTELAPKCPTLLIFADREEYFDAPALAAALKSKPNVTSMLLSGSHGFCDPFSVNYNPASAAEAERLIENFLHS